MIQLMALLLVGPLTGQVAQDAVLIHEWGVIEVDEMYLTARGAPDGSVDEDGYFHDYPEVEVTAPVVYFHGAECRGELRVRISDGYFTTLLPYPLLVEEMPDPEIEGSLTYTAIWEGLIITGGSSSPDAMTGATEVTRGSSMADSFSWAVPFWREVPANNVHYQAAGFEDVFIYYESAMNSPEMFMGDNYGHVGEALLFFPEDGELTCVNTAIPSESDANGETLSDPEILMELYQWADGGLLMEEVMALWSTWKPLLLTRCELMGQSVMLFPLSDEEEELVSRLLFEPDDADIEVKYERLLLGLGSIRR